MPHIGGNFPAYKLKRRCISNDFRTWALREKCPNTEFFLVRILLYSVRIQENADQKKLRIWTLFTQWGIFSTAIYNVISGVLKVIN